MGKNLAVDSVTIKPNGVLEIRFQKQILDTDGTVLSFEYHRTVCEPFIDYRDQLLAVEKDLNQTERGNWPSLSIQDKDAIGQIAAREHTPAKAAARLAFITSQRSP